MGGPAYNPFILTEKGTVVPAFTIIFGLIFACGIPIVYWTQKTVTQVALRRYLLLAGADTGHDNSIFEWVEVSPDFDSTNCVYIGNEYFEMWRSTDAGCSWDQLTFPCAPRPCISAWEVIDEDTVIAGAVLVRVVPARMPAEASSRRPGMAPDRGMSTT
jgi:hypothetical protein